MKIRDVIIGDAEMTPEEFAMFEEERLEVHELIKVILPHIQGKSLYVMRTLCASLFLTTIKASRMPDDIKEDFINSFIETLDRMRTL